jgi:hypothetical protein
VVSSNAYHLSVLDSFTVVKSRKRLIVTSSTNLHVILAQPKHLCVTRSTCLLDIFQRYQDADLRIGLRLLQLSKQDQDLRKCSRMQMVVYKPAAATIQVVSSITAFEEWDWCPLRVNEPPTCKCHPALTVSALIDDLIYIAVIFFEVAMWISLTAGVPFAVVTGTFISPMSKFITPSNFLAIAYASVAFMTTFAVIRKICQVVC